MPVSLDTKHHWMVHDLDGKYTLLNGKLKEEVYLMQLEGFVK